MFEQIATELGAKYQQVSDYHCFTIAATEEAPQLKIYTWPLAYDTPEGMAVYKLDTSYQSKWQGTYSVAKPKINISCKKAPKQIASEIKRRLLTPGNIATVIEVIDRVTKDDNHIDRQVQLMQSAGEILGKQWEPKRNAEAMYDGSVKTILEMRPTHDSKGLDIFLKGITLDQFKQIKAILI